MPSTVSAPSALPDAGPGSADDSGTSTATWTRRAAVTALLTAGGVAGRAAFQNVPSVEPLVAVAVAIGFYANWRHGAVAGASGYAASNFLVWGGQGPWTLFQASGAGLAGVVAGLLGARTDDRRVFLLALVLGVAGYEAVINLGSLLYMPWIPTLAAAAPFALVHVASTLGFGLILYGLNTRLETLYRGRESPRGTGTSPGRGNGGSSPVKHILPGTRVGPRSDCPGDG